MGATRSAEFERLDARLRLALFAWLQQRGATHRLMRWRELMQEFSFDGERIPLVQQRGIWRVRKLRNRVLTIRTSPDNPYGDSFGADDGLLRYCYFQSDPQHPDNAALREAMQRKLPLAYFHGQAKGMYQAVWPVFVVGEDRADRSFSVAADDVGLVDEERVLHRLEWTTELSEHELHRKYVTASVRRRLHQGRFRQIVLSAYRGSCALCRLRHRELLDAAHIIPDREDGGEPTVRNGLALCKIHHAAFDQNIVGIRPDHRVEVRQDVLAERDGPMLRHGLQEMEGRRIFTPRAAEKKPDPELLEERFERFRSAS